jgi:predicted negative regulator of RcsB-dependent stress response
MPGASSALTNMGDIYQLQGKMREAILSYEQALLRESSLEIEKLDFDSL